MIANIAYLVEAGTQNQFTNGGHDMVWIDVTNIAFSLGDFMFTEAHWLFAFYYMKIAKNMPKVIEQSDEP
jgi:hypothetical protein